MPDEEPRWDHRQHYDAAFRAMHDEQYMAVIAHSLMAIYRLLASREQ